MINTITWFIQLMVVPKIHISFTERFSNGFFSGTQQLKNLHMKMRVK